MEQYDKGEVRVVEAPPIFVLNETGIEMKVNAGSKIRNLMGFAMKKMKEVWFCSFEGTNNKTDDLEWIWECYEQSYILCRNYEKKNKGATSDFKGLLQKVWERRIISQWCLVCSCISIGTSHLHGDCLAKIEEYWEPKIEGLERLKVNRDIPAISILLSKEPLDSTELGYQAPGSYNAFWKSDEQNTDKPAKKYSYGRSGPGGDNFKKREKKRKNDFQKSQGEKQDNPKMKKDSQNLKVNQQSS